MSDVKIMFSIKTNPVGEMESSFTSFDAGLHKIPQNILNQISNADSVEISFSINDFEYNKSVEKLDKIKLITWMYENCMFSLRAADLLTAEINKGTFTIS